MKKRNQLEDLDVNRRIQLKLILKKWGLMRQLTEDRIHLNSKI
jgi:hypothetical protein